MSRPEVFPYADMLRLPRHVSARRQPMTRLNRAAQFAPFDALAGYSEAVQETARLTERRIGPDEDALARLNRRLAQLADALADTQPEVTFLCFIPDAKKEGGAYRRVTGRVRRMDEAGQQLLLTDGTSIPIASIDDLDGPLFHGREPPEGG
ncbi:MAG: hypothetical protein ACI4O7_04425 [Aristaeellaceae bacterium]